jgi:adenylate kinase family enzyme
MNQTGSQLHSSPMKDSRQSSPSTSDSVEFVACQNGKKVRLSAVEKHMLNTTYCETCGGLFPFENNEILLCDGPKCNKAYHMRCLTPELTVVPPGDFFGPCCESSKKPSGKASGRGHIRRMRLLNRSSQKPDTTPLEGLISEFGQSFSSRNRSNLVERLSDDPPLLRRKRTLSRDSTTGVNPAAPNVFAPEDGSTSEWQSVNSVESRPETSCHSALMTAHTQLVNDLSEIVGMDHVKELLIDINGKIVLRKERIRRKSSDGQKIPSSGGTANHMLILGNPGTGKSMIGRILAKMLYRSNAVKRDVFIRAHRSDLVAGYIGQTAQKTAQLIEQARGGVMFIDEAHQLMNPNKDDYGIEAYREIMREMLSDRSEDRVTFVFAGYPQAMKKFLKHDAGMESRISFRISLPDYSLEELGRICKFKLEHRDPTEGLPCEMDDDVDFEAILDMIPFELLPKYNARIADLLLDKSEAFLARRVLGSDLSKVDIMRLSKDDFENAANSLRKDMMHAAASVVNSPDSGSEV